MNTQTKQIVDKLHAEADIAKHTSERVLNALESAGYKVTKSVDAAPPALKTSNTKESAA